MTNYNRIRKIPILTLLLLATLLLLLLPQASFASKERFLKWKETNIVFDNGTSIKIEAEGPIYKKFVVNAFNKSFELSPQELKQIEGLSLSLLNVTQEPRYEEVGGESIHFKLSNYLFANPDSKIKTAVLTIQRSGVTITEDYITPANLGKDQ